MTRKLRLTLASILALVALGAIAPAANAYIYWTDSFNGTIGRANLDGTGANQSFISGLSFVSGLAVDGSYIYFSLPGTDSIARADLAGFFADYSFITGVGDASGIAVQGEGIYWSNDSFDSIGRANLDGTGANQSFITGGNYLKGVAVNDNFIYWGNVGTNTIGRADLSGSPTTVIQSFIAGALGPREVAVDDDFIYWTSGSTIGRANLDGTDANPSFISGASGAGGVAVDDKFIYWANSTGTIGRANLDGTGANQSFITGLVGNPKGLAVDPLPYPSPIITRAAKPTKRSLKVKVGCGDANTCMLRLTGKKVGTNAAITPKTVSVGAGEQPTVTLRYSPRLRRAVARGGRVSVTATNTTTDSKNSIVVQVAR